MNNLKKKIFICNFTKTISSAVLTAVAINIIMTNATKYALIEGLLPFALAAIIVALIDFYEYIDVSVRIRLIWMIWSQESKNWRTNNMEKKDFNCSSNL